jgi:hypothetical protein
VIEDRRRLRNGRWSEELERNAVEIKSVKIGSMDEKVTKTVFGTIESSGTDEGRRGMENGGIRGLKWRKGEVNGVAAGDEKLETGDVVMFECGGERGIH